MKTIDDLKKLKMRIWIQIVKDRIAWNDLVKKTQTQCRVVVAEEERDILRSKI